MITAPGNRIQQHFGRYTPQLYVALATLLVGVLFGVLAISTLSLADKLSLLSYIRRFLSIEVVAPTYHHVFQRALADNLKVVGLLYLLGVSVAGMPLVLILVFFRGFVLGFASAFLVGTMHWQGVGVGIATIGLANLFMVPALVIAAAVALGFSWDLISPSRRQDGAGLARGFAFFTGLVVVMAAVTLVGTAIEAYVAPFLLHFFGNWGI